MPKRTFLDSGVLLAITRSEPRVMNQALAILNDPDRDFVSSVFLKLELLPLAVFFQKKAEISFLQAYLNTAMEQPFSDAIAQIAYDEACKYGLNSMDALHVATAATAGATELVTTERVTKPIHRTQLVKVVLLQ